MTVEKFAGLCVECALFTLGWVGFLFIAGVHLSVRVALGLWFFWAFLEIERGHTTARKRHEREEQERHA